MNGASTVKASSKLRIDLAHVASSPVIGHHNKLSPSLPSCWRWAAAMVMLEKGLVPNRQVVPTSDGKFVEASGATGVRPLNKEDPEQPSPKPVSLGVTPLAPPK